MIAEVPFENASERVTIMLDQLRAAFKWPEVFEEERFANDKKLFDDIVARMRKEDEEGEISDKTLREARQLVNDLRAKITAQPLKDEDDQKEADEVHQRLHRPHGYARQARHPRRPSPSSGRSPRTRRSAAFWASCTPITSASRRRPRRSRRRSIISSMPSLDQTRDQILSEAKLDKKKLPSAHPKVITDFYGNIRRRRTHRIRSKRNCRQAGPETFGPACGGIRDPREPRVEQPTLGVARARHAARLAGPSFISLGRRRRARAAPGTSPDALDQMGVRPGRQLLAGMAPASSRR